MKSPLDLVKLNRQPTALGRFTTYLRVILFWCPTATLIFSVGLNGFRSSWTQMTTSLIISITVASTCMWGSFLLARTLTLIASWRGLAVPSLAQGLRFWLSAVFLLPGLYLGFRVAETVSLYFGEPWTIGYRDYGIGVVYGVLLSGTVALFEIMRELKETRRESQLRLQRLENENLKAQVSALTAQMNPHLLFNTLNTIASAISTDPAAAEEMVVQLSEIYRGILRSARDDVHSLSQELELCRAYLEIEKKRFGSRISYVMAVDNSIDIHRVQIPVLLLQPIIENSIQHGLSPKLEGGSIHVAIRSEARQLLIEVTDNGVGPEHARPSRGTGSGLANSRARLLLKYGDTSLIRLERRAQNTVATLRLPYLEEQT